MTSVFQFDSALSYDASIAYDTYAPAETASTTFVPLPHLSASLQLAPDRSFSFLQQDSLDEVTQSVEMICGTNIGDRTVTPTFGIPPQPFVGPNKEDILRSIGIWENRVTAEVQVSTNDDGTASISVAVALSQGASV